MEFTIKVVTFLIFLVALVVWAIIGFIFWIPMLTRATTVFAGMILYATLTGQKADALREYLRLASGFYPDGFRITKDALYPTDTGATPSEIEFYPGRFILEFFWTIVFWVGVLWIGQPTLLTPLTGRSWRVVDSALSALTPFGASILALCMLGLYVLVSYLIFLERRRGLADHMDRLNTRLPFDTRSLENRVIELERLCSSEHFRDLLQFYEEVSEHGRARTVQSTIPTVEGG